MARTLHDGWRTNGRGRGTQQALNSQKRDCHWRLEALETGARSLVATGAYLLRKMKYCIASGRLRRATKFRLITNVPCVETARGFSFATCIIARTLQNLVKASSFNSRVLAVSATAGTPESSCTRGMKYKGELRLPTRNPSRLSVRMFCVPNSNEQRLAPKTFIAG